MKIKNYFYIEFDSKQPEFLLIRIMEIISTFNCQSQNICWFSFEL